VTSLQRAGGTCGLVALSPSVGPYAGGRFTSNVPPASRRSRANFLAMHLPPLDTASLRLAWMPVFVAFAFHSPALMMGLLLSSVLRLRLLLGCG
jgi:hypothetical protein